jgi:hypothetical protein
VHHFPRNEIGYAEKLERLERAVEVNALVPGGIYRLATINSNDTSLGSVTRDLYVEVGDYAKAREALKHFVGDWGKIGRGERSQAFGLVLDALKRLGGEVSGKRGRRVLVPGAGHGRPAREIVQLVSFLITRMPSQSQLLTRLARIR